MSRKITKRKAPAVAAHEPAFREIIYLIAAARHRAFQTVNTELIDLYWRGGFARVSPLVTQIKKSHRWCDKVVLHKSLSTAETIEMDARPHPGHLSLKCGKRENRSSSSIVIKVLGDLVAFCFDSPRRGDMQVDSQKIYGDHWLLPLLGGEGKGEGEREHKLLLCLP